MPRKSASRSASRPVAPVEPGELRIEYLRLDELRRRPGNPKGHDVAGLNLAFERFGFVDLPILDERDGTLVAGHGRLDTLEERRAIGEAPPDRIKVAADGQWLVPVVRGIAFSDDGEALAYTVASNKLVERGGWDDELLRAAVAAIGETGERFAGTGYDEAEAEALLAVAAGDSGPAAKGDESDGDAAARDETALAGALNAPAFCRDGDLWQLGRHRLLVGDCTQVDIRGQLLDGGYADVVVMDSPYAIFGSSTGVASDVADDTMALPAFESYLRAAGGAIKVYGLLYVCCDWRSWATFWAARKRVGLTPKNMLVWDKKNGGLGQTYLLQHELVGVWSRLPRKNAVGDDLHRDGPKGKRQRKIPRPNVLRYDRVRGVDREHNAQKPFEMACDFIRDATDPGELVLSPFCGSGTELVAAEHTGRRCATLEILPRQADKAIMRWIRFTNGTATRASDGATFPAG